MGRIYLYDSYYSIKQTKNIVVCDYNIRIRQISYDYEVMRKMSKRAIICVTVYNNGVCS